MSDVAAPLPLALPRRVAVFVAAVALAASAGGLAWRLSPSSAPALALGLIVGLAALGAAALVDAGETPLWAKVFATAAAACALVACAPEASRLSVGVLSLAL